MSPPEPSFELALSFKGRPLSSHPVVGPRLIVGRDPGCDLIIDSLAVAPRHLAIQVVDGRLVLVALTAEHPVLRNGMRVIHAALEEGDRLLVGKHSLSLVKGPEGPALPPHPDDEGPQTEAARPVPAPRGGIDAYLQIQGGRRIGKILTLRRTVTRLHRVRGGEVIVSRRGPGYVLSRLGQANRVLVGGEPVLDDREVPLIHGVPIEIDCLRCQFFQTPITSVAQTPRSLGPGSGLSPGTGQGPNAIDQGGVGQGTPAECHQQGPGQGVAPVPIG